MASGNCLYWFTAISFVTGVSGERTPWIITWCASTPKSPHSHTALFLGAVPLSPFKGAAKKIWLATRMLFTCKLTATDHAALIIFIFFKSFSIILGFISFFLIIFFLYKTYSTHLSIWTVFALCLTDFLCPLVCNMQHSYFESFVGTPCSCHITAFWEHFGASVNSTNLK